MARLRSIEKEGKGGFPPCNLLGALWASTLACFEKMLSSVSVAKSRSLINAAENTRCHRSADRRLFIQMQYFLQRL